MKEIILGIIPTLITGVTGVGVVGVLSKILKNIDGTKLLNLQLSKLLKIVKEQSTLIEKLEERIHRLERNSKGIRDNEIK